jgi:hypothetical protein
MYRMGRSFCLAAAAMALLVGCLGGSPAPTASYSNGNDTAAINPNGTRKDPAPRVSYYTHDSVVTLRIVRSSGGDQNWYWIFRNGELRDQPGYSGRESDGYVYLLSDTVHEGGSYLYTARYGQRISDLGLKSPAFTYVYPGRSPSGTVILSIGTAQSIYVDLMPPPHSGASRARFERRIGADGAIAQLDTMALPDRESVGFRDTGFVPYDTMLYYRGALMDAASEAWLEPTAWDSLRVFNRSWTYVPEIRIENLGLRVRVGILNAMPAESKERAFYFLYRGRTPARGDGTKCDSLPAASISLKLADTPPDTGTWYYWAEALDPHGRTSPRSEAVPVRISGDPSGPAIEGFSVYSNVITIRARPYENATAYILQRTRDTSASPADADTLTGGDAQLDPYFADVPPGDGYWFYRVIAVAGMRTSLPGAWSRSDYFRREDRYSVLSAPIRNLGEKGVRAELPYPPSRLSVLYRSSSANGADSLAVDSIAPSDTTLLLRDMPPKGAWYYRAYTYPKPVDPNYAISRTAWVRIDYSGKTVGPAITRLDLLGMGIDVRFAFDPDAIAYILERSPDTSGIWTVIDTLSVYASSSLIYSDHPPRNGIWSYRARSLTPDLGVTEPGPSLATEAPWIFRVVFDNSLSVSIANRGDRVECPLTTTSTYGYYFKRGPSADYSDPVTVDSALVGDGDAKMTDVPPKKAWYYWVERMIMPGVNASSILRSVPVRVDFTGAPEVISLSRLTRGIRVEFPSPDPGDTLQIWRSAGEAQDSASYSLAFRTESPGVSEIWIDTLPVAGNAAFYHYRIILRKPGIATGFGPAKTFYFVPE